jgi:putative glutamine amidotransferase
MDKKTIGIVAWKTGDNSIGITAPYYDFFSQFGKVRIISPADDIIPDLDLLILPGGSDVNPMRYKQEPKVFTSNPDIFKEYFDEVKLPEYIKQGTKIFGICRGLQTLAVFFGGTLEQSANHAFYSSERTDRVHAISTFSKEGKPIGATFKVNSMHHQCVEEVSLDMYVFARCKEDNTIEGMAHKTLPIYAVQWHPEEIWDRFSVDLIKNLLNPNSK